jgi:hypothetical protein
MVRLAIALICALLATAVPVVAGPTTAVAAPTASSAAIHAPTVLARGFGSRGFGSRRTYYRPRTRGYSPYRARRGRGFLRGLFHGLFWGWMLSHFFGGGFPLFLPLLLIVFLLVATRRRRPPTSYRW